MNIFVPFESECHAKKDLYENVDATRVQATGNHPKRVFKNFEYALSGELRKIMIKGMTNYTEQNINAYSLKRSL